MGARTVAFAFVLLGVTGCPRPPQARPDAAARRDGGVARADAGAAAPADPCAILEPQQRDLVVARIGDQSMTLCDFTRRVNSQNPYLRARFNAPEQRRALLQSWVDAELLAAEAQHRGLDREPEVRRAVIIQLARRLEQSVRDAVPDPTVTDPEVRAYYEAHRAEYDTDAEVRASQIVLATREEAQRVLADVRAHEADDAYFRQQARTRTTEQAQRATEGDVGFFPHTGGAAVVPEVADAAFSIERNGQILDHVVESAHGGPDHGPGFHVIRRTARRDALHRTLDDEQARIRRRLMNEKLNTSQDQAVQALVTRLRASSPVTIDEAALAAVHVDAEPRAGEGHVVAPPAIPGGPNVPVPSAAHPAGVR